MSIPTAERKRLEATQKRLNAVEATAAEKAVERDAAVLAAQEAGGTRADLQVATGLSPARITQILRRQRERRATA